MIIEKDCDNIHEVIRAVLNFSLFFLRNDFAHTKSTKITKSSKSTKITKRFKDTRAKAQKRK